MAPKSGVLFINKSITSKNLSRSDGAEKSRIFSHVQQPLRSRLPLSPPETPGLPGLCGEEAMLWSDSSSGSDKKKRRDSKPKKARKESKTKVEALGCHDDVTTQSPLVTVSVEEVDPFSCTAAPISQYMSSVLEFYSGTMLDVVFPTKLLADISRQHTLSYASEDAVCLNAILCTTAGAMYERSGDFKHGYNAMCFKGQAIYHLKQELAKSGNCKLKISTLYAVSLLLWIECLQGDLEAVKAHIQGLNRLVSFAGGIRESPLPVMTTILSSSYYCAAMLQARPVLEPPEIAEQDIALAELDCLSLCQDSDFRSAGSRFFRPENSVIVGLTLLQLIAEQQRCTAMKNQLVLGDTTANYKDLEKMYLAQMATEYRLLEIPFSEISGGLTAEQDAIRLAVYVSSVPIIAFAPKQSAFCRSMARQLRAALERTEMSTLWSGRLDMLLWVLFIAAEISVGQEEWPWLISHISMIVQILDLESMSEMEHILTGFNYMPNVFCSTLKTIWQEVDIFVHSPDS